MDGLEVKLVQAGTRTGSTCLASSDQDHWYPYGLDLRLLGIKITLAGLAAFLLVLVGQPLLALAPGCCSSCPTTGC